MFKKLAIFLFSCALTVSATTAFTQDAKPAADTTTPAVDTQKPAEPAKPVEPAIVILAEKAKTYFDGAATYANPKVLFKITARDNLMADKVLYKLDGGAETTYSNEFAITAEGKHTVSYYGVDKIGNKEDEKSFSVIIDNSAPTVAVTPKFPLYLSNGKYYISKLYSFNVNAVDTLSGVNRVSYTVNGKDYSDYATAFSVYADGDATFSIKAEDNVGNKSSKFKIKVRDEAGKETVQDSDTISLFVDNIAPAVSVTTDKQLVPVNGKNVGSKEFKYTVAATDKESGVKMVLVRIDGKGDFVPYDGAIQFATTGDHFIEAKAIDSVGNISDTVILALYVDTIPPKTEFETIQ